MSAPSDGAAERLARLAPPLAAALALALFVWRAAPGVTFEDSGELLAATATLGVPHPPGYPLQMMLGRAWLLLCSPFVADVARALNLFSAACAAGAVGLLASFAVRLGARFGAALATGVLLAASTTFAAQAVVTEVYALAALLCVALLGASLGAPRPLFRSALLFGLGLAAHPGSVFFAPLVLAAALREHREGRVAVRRLGARAGLGLALGLAPYLYVPLAAARDPVVNFGRIDGLGRLADHLLRAQYRTGLELPLSDQAPFLVEQLAGQWPLALALCVLALGACARHVPRGAFAAVAATLVVTAVGLLLSVGFPLSEPEVRWRVAGSFVPLVVATAALCGLGLIALERGLAGRVPAAALALGLPLGVGLLATALPPATLATAVDQRRATWAEDYAREVLEACPPDAVLVVSGAGYGDVLWFPLLYAQVVDGRRPDVLVLDRELLPHAWFREELAARRPELARAVADLERAFAANPRRTLSPRDQRVLTASFFPALYRLERPVVFVTRPSPRLVGERSVVPGPVLWHVAPGDPGDPGALDGPPGYVWLPPDDPDPWIAELRRRARERDRLRAAVLEARGEIDAAAELRERWR